MTGDDPVKLPLAAVPGVGLEAAMGARTAPSALHHRRDDGRFACHACAHRCVVAPRRAGACGVRFERDGELRVPWGYVARRYVRAVETNTVFHVLPGARALTFGMYGCDLRCPYCHNAKISQALREGVNDEAPSELTPEVLVDEALAAGCQVVCAAYNEPMISAEWLRAIFAAARARGLVTVIVSDGHSTPEALAYVQPVTDVFRVDLKSYDRAKYKELGGRLEPVLDSIERARALGLWVEVVTLVAPGISDDATGLSRLAATLCEIDRDIPWHVNGFVPRYRMQGFAPTSGFALMSAAGSGYARGLRFVYAGNVPELPHLAHTRCPECQTVVVRRANYQTVASDLVDGGCPRCQAPIPGVWSPPIA